MVDFICKVCYIKGQDFEWVLTYVFRQSVCDGRSLEIVDFSGGLLLVNLADGLDMNKTLHVAV